jgi:hypothetical protein
MQAIELASRFGAKITAEAKLFQDSLLFSLLSGNLTWRRVRSGLHRQPVICRSVPDTWVTVYSGDIGNTFGPKGLSSGSSLHVSWSK